MKILGISAYYHDAAACLVIDGEIIAAAQEERFTRRKNDASFPVNSIVYCLSEGRISSQDIDFVVFYDKPFLKFERLLETYLAFAPRGFKSFATSLPIWLKDKLFQKTVITNALKDLWGKSVKWEEKLLFSEHHLSHAASAFFPSPFERAAVLTMDGVGEWTTTSLAVGKGHELSVYKEIHFPHSAGLLYSAMTYYTGFKVNSGEYKVMGLAPYGKPKYVNLIKDHLIDIKEDGSFALDMSFFDYCTGLTMTNDKFDVLFGGPPRKPESTLTQREMDLAASVQAVIEEVVLKLAKGVAKTTGEKTLCMAGGVALNCVANGKLLREKVFDRLWIQPAAGDAGGALGAALGAYHIMLNQPRKVSNSIDGMKGSYLGPQFSQQEITERLTNCGAVFETLTEDQVIERTAQALASGKAVGWMNGRMEFGPRALGNRSIIADPRSPTMQKLLNLKVKYRESFRPFAPSVLREDVSQWFEMDDDSPYMLLVADVVRDKRRGMTEEEQALFGIDKLNVQRSEIPAVTHVDYSARVQTVHKETNPRYHATIARFKELTGCPLIVNTSFNVRSEPIICTPEDAFRCFMGTELEVLVIGSALLQKDRQLTGKISDKKQQAAFGFIAADLGEIRSEDIIQVRSQSQVFTKEVVNFYSESPFPNYEDFESINNLLLKIEKNIFLSSFKSYLGLNKKILEVGSGTSQLSIALAARTNNEVVALDPTLDSLKLGYDFARNNKISNVTFLHSDLFDAPLRHDYFDVVFCSGVLHHTKDPRKGFDTICNWIKPNGMVVVGLYNKYGRLRTVFRQKIYKILEKFGVGRSFIYKLDPYLRSIDSEQKKNSWFRDQYIHPHESLHTMDEVLEWFDSNNIDFMGSLPSLDGFNFKTFLSNRGTRFERRISEIGMLFQAYGGEGGLFLMFGRKKC
jgi:carbamoyltransferase